LIELPADLLEAMVAHARRETPCEACGWMAGRGGKITRVFPVPNAAEDPLTRFLMEPVAQIRTMRKVAEMGLDLVGTYHSHPRTLATPSARDMDLAAYPEIAHLILPLSNPEPEIRCYCIAAEGVSILELAVEKAAPQGDRLPVRPKIAGFCDLCNTECSSLLQATYFVTISCSNHAGKSYKEA
jgi:proteasome lid subunit RPN8/RPN11